MAWSVGFDSTLPARLGLPPLPGPNRAEGVIIRPVQTAWVDTRKGRARPFLKKKIPDFAETAAFHQARAWGGGRRGQETPRAVAERLALAALTPARLASARSQVGRDRPAALAAELAEDVWETLEEAGALADLDAEERALLRSVVVDEAALAAGP
jgi:hypothetical protein